MKSRCADILIKIIFIMIILSVLIFAISACNYINEVSALPVLSDYEMDEIVEVRNIRVGVVSGPYGDMFKEAILPSLERMGYTANFTYFANFIAPNFALAQNEIDINIFQHYTYLNSFKFENDLALTAIMEIPTVSMGIFSSKLKSIEDLVAGITVSIPDDASNLARALRVLEAANVISLDPFMDKSKATISDIVSNPYEIRFVLIEAHDLVTSLDLVDMSVINGNYAFSGGLYLPDALYQEVLVEGYINVIAVRTEDLNKQFVRDIIEVIYSDEFRDVIIDPDGMFVGFQWPRWFHEAHMDMGELR